MTRRTEAEKTSVAVIYNHVGEDHFEKFREVDPASLEFTPVYPLNVATVMEEYHAIARGLGNEGYQARLFNIEDDLARLQRFLSETPPDVIFNLVEIFRGNPRLESAITALFDLYEIPYTGSAPFALEVCQRKALTKLILLKQEIATPDYRLLRIPKIPRRHGLHYPLIVKPAREDASLGVEAESVVYDYDQLISRIRKVFESFEPPILVEEYIAGKELHVSILGNQPPQALPIIEFDFSSLPEDHPAIITYGVKWNPLDLAYHRVHSICPATLSKKVEGKVREQALRAYQATYCRDYARIDVRLTESRVPFVLEVNPNPDLTESVSFMQSAERAGLTFSETLGRIVEFALARAKKHVARLAQQST